MTTAGPASLSNWPHKKRTALALDEGANIGMVQLRVRRPTLARIRQRDSWSPPSGNQAPDLQLLGSGDRIGSPVEACWSSCVSLISVTAG
jgi:hypothetical protein